MASSSSKRSAVLSLAEQLGCPTGYDRYELKLPFYNKTPYHSHLECSCRNTGNGSTCVRCAISISFAKTNGKALQQTKKRWAWFSEGRKLDKRLGTRLGTLGYLPLEVREMIWHAAIEDCMGASTEISCYPGLWRGLKYTNEWNHGPLDMDLTPEIILQPHNDETELRPNFHPRHLFHRTWQDTGVLQLREVSPDVKIEIENVLVSNYPFRFRCPVVLIRYLNTASARQLNRLPSIIVELSSYCEEGCDRPVAWRSWLKARVEAWIAAVERLPAAIELIKFEIDWTYLYAGDPSRYINEVLAQLEIMSKKTQRLAPNATVKVSILRESGFKDRDILRGITDEIENHSEDYKKWWRESREKTKSQREEECCMFFLKGVGARNGRRAKNQNS